MPGLPRAWALNEKKLRRIILQISLGRQNKDEVFRLGGKKDNNVLNLGNNKCICAKEICFSIFITGL